MSELPKLPKTHPLPHPYPHPHPNTDPYPHPHPSTDPNPHPNQVAGLPKLLGSTSDPPSVLSHQQLALVHHALVRRLTLTPTPTPNPNPNPNI